MVGLIVNNGPRDRSQSRVSSFLRSDVAGDPKESSIGFHFFCRFDSFCHSGEPFEHGRNAVACHKSFNPETVSASFGRVLPEAVGND